MTTNQQIRRAVKIALAHQMDALACIHDCEAVLSRCGCIARAKAARARQHIALADAAICELEAETRREAA